MLCFRLRTPENPHISLHFNQIAVSFVCFFTRPAIQSQILGPLCLLLRIHTKMEAPALLVVGSQSINQPCTWCISIHPSTLSSHASIFAPAPPFLLLILLLLILLVSVLVRKHCDEQILRQDGRRGGSANPCLMRRWRAVQPAQHAPHVQRGGPPGGHDGRRRQLR